MASTQIKKEEDRWEITQAVKLESHIKFCIAAEPNKYYMKDSIICAILMVNSVNNDDAYVAWFLVWDLGKRFPKLIHEMIH